MNINLANPNTTSPNESYGVNNETFDAASVEPSFEVSNHEEVAKKKINLKPVIRWVFYALTFLMPLFFLPWTSELLEFNKQSLLILGASVGLVLFLVEVIQNGAVVLKPSRFYLPMAGLVVASIVSSVFSLNQYQSILGAGGEVRLFSLATVVALVVIFFLMVNVIEDKGKALKKAAVLSVGLSLLIGLFHVFGFFLVSKPPYNSFGFNTVGSLNSLAILAALLLPLFLETKIRVLKFLDLSKIAAALALFLIILVNWWIVWIAVFIALISWMSLRILEAGKASMKDYIFPISVVVIGLFLMITNFAVPVLKQRLPVEVAPSFKSSVNIAMSALKEKPFFGFGLGEFSVVYDKFKPEAIAQTIFARTHFGQAASSFLTSVVEGGVVMTLAILFLVVVTAMQFYRSPRREGFLALAMVLFFFLFSFNLTLLFFLFFSLALLELASPHQHSKELVFENSAKYSLIGSAAFVLGLVLCLAGNYFVTLRYVADAYYVKAVNGTNADTVIADFTKGINLNSKDSKYYRLLSRALLIKFSNELNDKNSKTPVKERTQKLQNLATSAVEIAKQASDLNPHDVENWLNRGVVYQNLVGIVGGADQAAVSMYQEAIKRSPADPFIYNSIGSVHLTLAENARVFAANPPANQPNLDLAAIRQQATDNFAKAEESYKKAISLNNNYGQALFALGVVYEREGKLPEAIKQFERLRVGNPNDPSIAFELGLLYYRSNKKDMAFNQLQEAAVLFPDYSNARWYLSLLYEERGDIANALVQVEEIQKTNSESEVVKQRIDQLRAGLRIIPPQKVLDQKPL